MGIINRVIQIVKPSNPELEALYSSAFALIYPSRAEGFGWPIIEAQACGCPVVCSDQTSVPEVAGDGAIVCAVEEHEAFAQAILQLTDPIYRKARIKSGNENLLRFSLDRMIADYLRIYQKLIDEPLPEERESRGTEPGFTEKPALHS